VLNGVLGLHNKAKAEVYKNLGIFANGTKMRRGKRRNRVDYEGVFYHAICKVKTIRNLICEK
jgi:hypothetical protein